MISKLITVLKDVGIVPTSTDLADILWLAKFLDKSDTSIDKKHKDKNQEKVLTKKDAAKHSKNETKQSETKGKLLPKTSDHTHTQNIENKSGIEPLLFKTPTGSALPGKLLISRALRPLMRKVPSRTSITFDENKTADAIAESDTWLPVMKPTSTQWLDVVMLVDESPSMIIWYETILELKKIFEEQGAFKNVQLWGFYFNEDENFMSLHPGFSFDYSQRQSSNPKELIDPANRRLILVVSDCVSSCWHNGNVSKMLKIWENNTRVTIIQMLPYHLWDRTALKKAVNVYFQNKSTDHANSKLTIEHSPFVFQKDISNSLKLPVIILEERSIYPWAKSLAGNSEMWIPGILLRLIPDENCEENCKDDFYEESVSDLEFSAENRLKYFFATSSPESQDLISCLATLPLTLPVIRLAQRAMFPNTKQFHIAEILLSDLIIWEKIENLKDISFEFKTGIRELLVRNKDIRDTLHTLSIFIENFTGVSANFTAILEDPSIMGDIFKDKTPHHFATISLNVLQLLGGKYASLANALRKENNDFIRQKDKNKETIKYKHDIFVSYAQVDDKPMFAQEKGWVSTLVDILKIRLSQTLGRKDFDLWKTERLILNDKIEPHIVEKEAVTHSAVLLVILSPGYLKSEWCRVEREHFLRANPNNKIFIVELNEIPAQEKPEALKDIIGYKFWYREKKNESVIILGYPKPDIEDKKYYYKINRLVHDLAAEINILRKLHQTPENASPRPTSAISDDSGGIVYLAVSQVDEYLTKDIIQILEDNGLSTSLPIQTGTPREIRTDHENNLRNCDGIVIVYGVVSITWVQKQLIHSRKIRIKREHPLKALAVYDGPPEEKTDINMMLPNMHMINCRTEFKPSEFQPFLHAMKGGVL